MACVRLPGRGPNELVWLACLIDKSKAAVRLFGVEVAAKLVPAFLAEYFPNARTNWGPVHADRDSLVETVQEVLSGKRGYLTHQKAR